MTPKRLDERQAAIPERQHAPQQAGWLFVSIALFGFSAGRLLRESDVLVRP